MEQIKMQMVQLIGIKLKNKTINEGGRSGIDCGNLWQEFEWEHISDCTPNKTSDANYAVYYNYEGDHTGPFSYFIGCSVEDGTEAPEGLTSLIIPEGHYVKLRAKGIIPGCVSDTWKRIWASDMKRAYAFDFEVYDDRSVDWTSAEVDIFVGHDANEVPNPLNGNQVLVFQRSLE